MLKFNLLNETQIHFLLRHILEKDDTFSPLHCFSDLEALISPDLVNTIIYDQNLQMFDISSANSRHIDSKSQFTPFLSKGICLNFLSYYFEELDRRLLDQAEKLEHHLPILKQKKALIKDVSFDASRILDRTKLFLIDELTDVQVDCFLQKIYGEPVSFCPTQNFKDAILLLNGLYVNTLEFDGKNGLWYTSTRTSVSQTKSLYHSNKNSALARAGLIRHLPFFQRNVDISLIESL